MKLLKYILAYFPTKLPVGATDFNNWSNDIITLAGAFADADSMSWAIANMVMHLPSTVDRKPKMYFVKCLRKAAANQIAGAKFVEIKERQEAAKKVADEAAKASQPVEATTPPQVASNESQETKS